MSQNLINTNGVNANTLRTILTGLSVPSQDFLLGLLKMSGRLSVMATRIPAAQQHWGGLHIGADIINDASVN